MLHDPNIHNGVQFSFTFFLKRKLVKGRAYAPTPPNFLGGRGVKMYGGVGGGPKTYVCRFCFKTMHI